jgi:hypothetical protein
MTIARFLARIVVMDVLLSLKLAAILKTYASLHPIELATFNQIGLVLIIF